MWSTHNGPRRRTYHGHKRQSHKPGGSDGGGNAGNRKAGAACPGAGAHGGVCHALSRGGAALRRGNFWGLRPLRAGAGGIFRGGPGRFLRLAGGLLRLFQLPGVSGRTQVQRFGHPHFFRGLCLLRRTALPQELVFPTERRHCGRRHRICLSGRHPVGTRFGHLFFHRGAAGGGVGLLLPHRLFPLEGGTGRGSPHLPADHQSAAAGGHGAHDPVQDHPVRRRLSGTGGGGAGGAALRRSRGDGHRSLRRCGCRRGDGPGRRGSALLLHGLRPGRGDGRGLSPAGQDGGGPFLCPVQRPGRSVDLGQRIAALPAL